MAVSKHCYLKKKDWSTEDRFLDRTLMECESHVQVFRHNNKNNIVMPRRLFMKVLQRNKIFWSFL